MDDRLHAHLHHADDEPREEQIDPRLASEVEQQLEEEELEGSTMIPTQDRDELLDVDEWQRETLPPDM
ncbi:MAG: hypothetical protein ACTHOD_14935 [Motilibacteraceae bacterium]